MLVFQAVDLEIANLARHSDLARASWKSARSALLDAAAKLREVTGQATLPIKLRKIADERCIKIELFASSRSPEATLAPVSTGFRLRLRPGNRTRNRFSTAHEIGHTFFYDLSVKPPSRFIAWNPLGGPWREEEDICNAFARELLMPKQLIDAERAAFPHLIGFPLVQFLARRSLVSPEAMLHRLMWDLGELSQTIALICDSSAELAASRTSFRRYWGRNISQAKLRKKERRALTDLEQAISVDSPPFARIAQVANDNSAVMSISTRLNGVGHRPRIMILVHLRDDMIDSSPREIARRPPN